MTPSPPTLPPSPAPPPTLLPATLKKVQVLTETLTETRTTVLSLSWVLGLGGLALAIVSAGLVYVTCVRRRVMAPHLTSVVDEDAIGVDMGPMGGRQGKDDILE